MKRWILGIGIALGVALGATEVGAQCPDADAAGCAGLCIQVAGGIGWQIDTSINLVCEHGRIAAYYGGGTAAAMVEDGLYGIDCRLQFVNPATGERSLYEFTQNYCFIQSGNFDLKYLAGTPAHWDKVQWAVAPTECCPFGRNQPGIVRIIGFSQNTPVRGQ